MKKLAVLFLFLSACHPSSNWLTNPPAVVNGFTTSGGGITKDVYNTCEVVVVLDDSGSMLKKVNNVRTAIASWGHAFLDKNPIHCHIGFLRNFDDYGKDRGQYTAQKAPGYLVPLANGKRWIDSDDPEAVDLVVQAMSEYKEMQPVRDGGSTYEAIFSAIVAFIDPLNDAHKQDKDFFMGPDSTTILMIVTDANDESKQLFPENVAKMLWDQKGGTLLDQRKKVITLGALLLKDQGDCKIDDAGAPLREVDLIHQTGGQVFNVCDKNFGENLATYGHSLRTRTIRRVIPLGGLVEVYREQKMDTPMEDCAHASNPHDLRVYYGPYNDEAQLCKNTLLKRGAGGYHYNPTKQQITIGEDFAYNTCANCTLHIAKTPISDIALRNGTAKSNDVPDFKRK